MLLLRQKSRGAHSLFHHEGGPEDRPAQFRLGHGHYTFSYVGLQVLMERKVER